MTTFARDRLTARLAGMPLRELWATVQACDVEYTHADEDQDARRIIADYGRRVLATRTDRYTLARRVDEHGRAQIVDQATGTVALACHTSTAPEWLAWYAGQHVPGRYDHDMRVCQCRHLSGSHGQTRADGSTAPGIGNGECGADGCGDCPEFRPAIARPALLFTAQN